MNYKILILPGDGIGKEVIREAEKVLQAIEKKYSLSIEKRYALIGGECLDKKGVPIEEETLEIAKKSDAVLLGAVGGPKWDNLPFEKKPEQGLLSLRKALNAFANIRPVKVFQSLARSSPLKEERIKDVDIIIIRELTGGIYFGEPRGIFIRNGIRVGVNTEIYSEEEIERIARVAFEIARKRKKKVTSVDKANVLESSVLWREVVNSVSKDYPDVTLSHMYVDNCAMQLIRNPGQFDVILTNNIFGDILSDEAAVLAGSIGLLPSASIGYEKKGIYEPIHGSAPDIAGTGKANPVATILSLSLMFRLSLDREDIAIDIERAVEKVIEEGFRTEDLGPGKTLSTSQMGDEIVKKIEES
jgi:3-isopropylmalate dehydrogenase